MSSLRSALVPIGLAYALGSAACVVPKTKYDKAVSEANAAKAQLELMSGRAAQRMQADDRKISDLSGQVSNLSKNVQERDTSLSEAQMGTQNLQAQLDESTAINQKLRDELARLGKNVDQLLSDKGTLSRSLEDAKARLEELRKAQAAAEARATLFRDLINKFKKMTDAGDLKVVLREGRMVLQLSNDVLFESAKADIRPQGQATLKQVASVLKSLNTRKFQVGGHTDNVPIRSSRFNSNWELSTARAVSVVHYLVEQGVKPEGLSAAGYGEWNPVSSNDTNDGKAKNRRIEIALMPNLDELIAVRDVK